MIVWSDEILEEIKKSSKENKIFVEIENKSYPITNIEDSQSVGWYEIRFADRKQDTININCLISNLPEKVMVMLQENNHSGNSYPIHQILHKTDGNLILKCNNLKSDYWKELNDQIK